VETRVTINALVDAVIVIVDADAGAGKVAVAVDGVKVAAAVVRAAVAAAVDGAAAAIPVLDDATDIVNVGVGEVVVTANAVAVVASVVSDNAVHVCRINVAVVGKRVHCKGARRRQRRQSPSVVQR
jgi:hypothetical protein